MKVVSTEALTKLIQLVKSAFIKVDDVVEVTEIETETPSEVTLATVATSGAYSDLSGTPTIPTVDQTYDATSANAQSGVAVASAISGKADDSAVVHKTGDETINGNKIFSNSIIKSTDSTWANIIEMNGTNKPYIAGYSSNNDTALALCTYHNGNWCNIEIHNNGTSGYATIPSPVISDNSTKIATTAYVNNKHQLVSTLPASPNADVYYYIPE